MLYNQDMNRFSGKKVLSALTGILLLITLSGCSAGGVADFMNSDTRVIITTGGESDHLFSIGDSICTLPEYLVYLITLQKEYEEGFTSALWQRNEGQSLVHALKENALARVSRVKTMVLLAAEHDITLTEEETARAQSAAEQFDAGLSDADRMAMGGIDSGLLTRMIAEIMLADKVYRYLIRDIDPEISDDEARRVTVQQIVLRSWNYDVGGNRVSMDAEEKKRLLLRAGQIRWEWEDGVSFDELAAAWNEAEETELSFGRGEVDPILERVAFSMAADEVSEPFETGDGIVLLHMVSIFDRAETEANKTRIMAERRNDAFNKEYDSFAAGLSCIFDEALYAQIDLTEDSAVTSSDFFKICDDLCENNIYQ